MKSNSDVMWLLLLACVLFCIAVSLHQIGLDQLIGILKPDKQLVPVWGPEHDRAMAEQAARDAVIEPTCEVGIMEWCVVLMLPGILILAVIGAGVFIVWEWVGPAIKKGATENE
jgi:hypothetical protein